MANSIDEAADSVRPHVIMACESPAWPAFDGGRQRRLAVLTAIAAANDTTFISFVDDDGDNVLPPALDHVTLCAVPRATSFGERVGEPMWLPLASRVRQFLTDQRPSASRALDSPEYVAQLVRLRRQHPHAIVWADSSGIAEMARDAGFTQITVDVDDFDSERLERAAATAPTRLARTHYALQAGKARRYEARLGQRFHTIVVARADDRIRIHGENVRVCVVPNGVTSRDAVPYAMRAVPPRILFVRTMGYAPNVDAIEYFVSSILPILRQSVPDLTVDVIGRRAEPSLRQAINVPGVVLHDAVDSLDPFYASASAAIVPMRQGSGTRIKVLEAMMYGRPVVGTSVAIEGIPVADKAHCRVGDTPATFAQAIVDIVRDPSAAESMATRARDLATARFSWDQIGRHVREALEQVESADEVAIVR
jgi:polysaccharide biosynthesis protein PslH